MKEQPLLKAPPVRNSCTSPALGQVRSFSVGTDPRKKPSKNVFKVVLYFIWILRVEYAPDMGFFSVFSGVPELCSGVQGGSADVTCPELIFLCLTQPQAGAVHTFHCLSQQLLHPGASGKFKPFIRVSMSQAMLAPSWMGCGQ